MRRYTIYHLWHLELQLVSHNLLLCHCHIYFKLVITLHTLLSEAQYLKKTKIAHFDLPAIIRGGVRERSPGKIQDFTMTERLAYIWRRPLHCLPRRSSGEVIFLCDCYALKHLSPPGIRTLLHLQCLRTCGHGHTFAFTFWKVSGDDL